VARLTTSRFPLAYEGGRFVLAPAPGEARSPTGIDEAKLEFATPRRIIGQTTVRWSADRGRLSSHGHASAAIHGYSGEFSFVGDGSCWRLTRIRATHHP
jgi:hypothetical protein